MSALSLLLVAVVVITVVGLLGLALLMHLNRMAVASYRLEITRINATLRPCPICGIRPEFSHDPDDSKVRACVHLYGGSRNDHLYIGRDSA